MLDTFYADKVKLKKFDTSAKLLADVGLNFATLSNYDAMSYDEGLQKKNGG